MMIASLTTSFLNLHLLSLFAHRSPCAFQPVALTSCRVGADSARVGCIAHNRQTFPQKADRPEIGVDRLVRRRWLPRQGTLEYLHSMVTRAPLVDDRHTDEQLLGAIALGVQLSVACSATRVEMRSLGNWVTSEHANPQQTVFRGGRKAAPSLLQHLNTGNHNACADHLKLLGRSI
jgi:hypothetical protein